MPKGNEKKNTLSLFMKCKQKNQFLPVSFTSQEELETKALDVLTISKIIYRRFLF